MLSWHHSGFKIYCGPTIWPHDKDALENLARYIVRASFSQERMTYIPANQSPEGDAWVIYHSKDGKTIKTFHALDWLAQLTTHIPNERNRWFVTMDSTAINPVECARKRQIPKRSRH